MEVGRYSHEVPIYHRMFGYNLNLLPNPQLAVLERGVTNIEDARKKSGATLGYPGWGIIYHLLLPHLDRKRTEVIIETGTNWGYTYKRMYCGIPRDSRVNGALKNIQAKHGGNLINIEHVSWYTPGLAVWQRRPNL